MISTFMSGISGRGNRVRPCDPPEQADEISFNIGEGGASRTAPRHEDHMGSFGGNQSLVAPVGFAHESPGPVPLHRATHPAPGHEAGATNQSGSGKNEQDDQGTGERTAFAVDPLEVRIVPEPFLTTEPLVGVALTHHP